MAFILIAAFLATLGTACRRAPEAAPRKAAIKIGGCYWPGAYWTDIADKKGWFKEAGLDVIVSNEDADFFGAINRFGNGQLDCMGLPFFDFVRLNADGKAVTGVIVTDYSSGAEAFIGKPGIGSFKELKGKKLGLAKNTYAEYIYTVLAERNKLAPGDVEIVEIQAETAADVFIKGEVDAIFAWEPLKTQALTEVAGSTVLFSTAEIPGIAGGIFCLGKNIVDTRPDEVQKLVRVWSRATDYMKSNPDEAYAIIAEIYQRPVQEVSEIAKLDRILGINDNGLAFSFASGFDSIHGCARQMNDFMLHRGLTKTSLDTSQIVDPSFIRALDE